MSDVLAVPVLVLNRYFQPVQMTTARRAMILLYGGTAQALDESGELYDFEGWRALAPRREDDLIPVVAGALRVPRVVHLDRYERVPRGGVRLTRQNVMARDGHQCQYCGRRPPLRDLNIDHVLPRSRGGSDSWENLVTSCRPCNVRKGWKTPEEANMRLARAPSRPRWSLAAQLLAGSSERFKEWDAYLKAS